MILGIHHRNFHYICMTFCVSTLCILACFSLFLFSNSSVLFLKIEFSLMCKVYDFLFQNSRTSELSNKIIQNKKRLLSLGLWKFWYWVAHVQKRPFLENLSFCHLLQLQGSIMFFGGKLRSFAVWNQGIAML